MYVDYHIGKRTLCIALGGYIANHPWIVKSIGYNVRTWTMVLTNARYIAHI